VPEPDAEDAADIGAEAREPLVIAHRGSSSAVAEHTVGAYRLAIAEGADGLECDVRLSADGELVCLHDRTLDRTGGSNGIVSAMTLAELRAVDWGAWKHASDSDRDPETAALVTLRELVELAWTPGGRSVSPSRPSIRPAPAGASSTPWPSCWPSTGWPGGVGPVRCGCG